MRIVRRSTIFTTLVVALAIGGGVGIIGAQAAPWGGWVGLAPAVIIVLWGFRGAFRRWRVSQQRFPKRWREWLQSHVPLYQRLDAEAAREFERDVQFAMKEYSFEGVRGVKVTDDLRLSVATGIAVLLHGRPTWELPGSNSVLFYPGRFDDDYYGGSREAAYDGMAHQQGPIILTAASAEHSWTHPDDGDNVVLHELAHLLDFDNEGADGVPSLVAPESAGEWQALVRTEMKRVRQRESILRPYAAEAPSEFFAVAVEAFFEQPTQMANEHPELYQALVAFFHLDPRTGRRTATPEGLRSESEAEEAT
ncbi:MAG: M90 family metallopeptidase [Salinivenus sp.]